MYFAGDGARQDADGYFWIMGRIRRRSECLWAPSRHDGTRIRPRLSSLPLPKPPVVGKPDDIKGEEIVAFVTLNNNFVGDASLIKELQKHVGMPKLARSLVLVKSVLPMHLPKTRSGKIMRRLLRDLAAGKEVSGDTSTLEDRSVLDKLRGND